MMAENWREGSVLEQYKHMLVTGYLSDCKFLVGQEPDIKGFRAHKMIMSRSSEVFHAMFYGALSEKDVVRVRDVTPAAFQALLYHVYCDTLEISDVEMSLSVCSAAHKYNLQPLINKCTEYIAGHMTPVNVCQVLEFSNLTDNTQLKTHCIKMLQSRTVEVLSADSWCDVQESSIVTLLQQDTLNVQSEISLLSACQRWAQHQLDVNNQPEDNNEQLNISGKSEIGLTENKNNDVDQESDQSELAHEKNQNKANKEQDDDKGLDIDVKLRDIAAPLLPHIRVLSLTSQQFLRATQNSIFSEKQKYDILKCIVDPENHKIPEGICEIKTARNTMPVCAVQKVAETDKGILIQFKSHLENISLQHVQFLYHSDWYIKKSEKTLHITKNIVIYGFQFHAMTSAKEDSVLRALSTNNEYVEKFTLQFVKEEKCLAKFVFDGKLKYDDKVNFFFSKPFLIRENSKMKITLELNHDVRRAYPYYYNSNAHPNYPFFSNVFSLVSEFNFCCLSQILYKII